MILDLETVWVSKHGLLLPLPYVSIDLEIMRVSIHGSLFYLYVTLHLETVWVSLHGLRLPICDT